MNKIISFFKGNYGYARMKDLKNQGFQNRKIKKLLEDGIIEKLKPGLYRLSNEDSEYTSLMDVCTAIPKGVICLISAMNYYNFTTFNPWEVDIAVPMYHNPPSIEYPPVRVFHFRENTYKNGIEIIKTNEGLLKIYSREKTVCDMFRLRKRLGEDLAIEGLRNYLEWSKNNTVELRKYMKITRMENVMSPYIKAMVNL